MPDRPEDPGSEPETYSVTVGPEGLRFAAAHFITFGRSGCEPLHGHNYRVRVTLVGPLNRSGYVYDFVALRRITRESLASLDHRVLLPRNNPRIAVSEQAPDAAESAAIVARVGERRYVFPAEDVALLPVANTTAELLAEHLARVLLDRVRSASGRPAAVGRLSVEVEEAPGQAATFHLQPDGGSAES